MLKHLARSNPMTPGAKLGVGLLGCGAFGRFCLREFAAMPGLRTAAVADTIPEAARKTGEEFAVPVCADIHALAARDDVQIIHIATPPSTHRELAVARLLGDALSRLLALRRRRARGRAARAQSQSHARTTAFTISTSRSTVSSASSKWQPGICDLGLMASFLDRTARGESSPSHAHLPFFLLLPGNNHHSYPQTSPQPG